MTELMEIYYRKYMKSKGKDIPISELEIVCENDSEIDINVINFIDNA